MQHTKHFAMQLNKGLDELGMPTVIRERAGILSKVLGIPRQQAWSLLEGHLPPDEVLLQQLSNALDLDMKWLHKISKNKDAA